MELKYLYFLWVFNAHMLFFLTLFLYIPMIYPKKRLSPATAMTVKLLIFNIASVISQHQDFATTKLISLAKQLVGLDRSSELDETREWTFPVVRERLLPKNSGQPEMVERLRRHFNQDMQSYFSNAPEICEADGVSQTFDFLKENGIHVALCSHYDRMVIQPLLNRTGWVRNRLIDACVAYDDVTDPYPHHDMIYRAMTLSGIINRQRVVLVGDSATDIQLGNEAGCKCTVRLTPGDFMAKGPHEPTHTIREVPEVLNILHYGGYFQFSPSARRKISDGIYRSQLQPSK